MNVHLMYRDADFSVQHPGQPQSEELANDLALRALFTAMVRDDKWLVDVVPKAVLASTSDVETINYRQNVLRDCIKNERIVRGLYDLATETFERRRKMYFLGGERYPSGILSGAVSILELLIEMLHKLRAVADQYLDVFESDGFRTLLQMLQTELDDAYFETVSTHLKELRFKHGVLVSAHLGAGNRGTDYVLRKNTIPLNWWERIKAWYEAQVAGARRNLGLGEDDRVGAASHSYAHAGAQSYYFELAPQDESGAQALSHLQDEGLNLVANAAAQSADHVLSFFEALRTELAFYVGCLNLRSRLDQLRQPWCFPVVHPTQERVRTARSLYDVCLALDSAQAVVGNDLDADKKSLIIVTGANQGGKSTFLRSVGIAQVMMQCGLFVGALSFEANAVEQILTHYKREEDTSMTSGKFDEEVKRMSAMADVVVPNALVLFNESFSSTNEREGSEIALEVVSALLEHRIEVVFVTHQYEFAHAIEVRSDGNTLFLRAERQVDGARTFKIVAGVPQATSYGSDLYKQIFEAA